MSVATDFPIRHDAQAFGSQDHRIPLDGRFVLVYSLAHQSGVLMRYSQARRPCRAPLQAQAVGHPCAPANFGRWLLGLTLLVALPIHAQDTGSAASEFYGKGVAITVIVHDGSGQPISSSAMVSLLRNGTTPAGQASTNGGRAELVVAGDLGDFTLVVAAAGYTSTQKDLVINNSGKEQVDIYLRALSTNSAVAPGRPVLAPKAKKAVDEGLQALSADNLAEAKKQAERAMRLAPGHPDVLYLQGVVLLKQRDWTGAQGVLEKATQVDPAHANAFAALGMALCDEGKFETAVAPLEKALQLNPASSWDTRWTLARAYYQQARYDQALAMSQTALSVSRGKAPEIELLVAQSLTAVGRYEDAAQTLRGFLRDHSDRREAATARRWLENLGANGKIHPR